ncbi:L-threonylcarbamoyladenylate synthase [Methanospirillum sp.]|uniref:L-threonylcarbamoyladenylate synthase n=1 Tax=Methanospirillum sp. TaxID=45200 RepID=UPI00345DE301
MKDLIQKAVEVLMQDGLIIYPTDTLYGLGADALSEEAVSKVFEAKGREYHKPLSIAVCDPEMIAAVAYVDDIAKAFIEEFLPGPATLVLRARTVLPPLLTAGTNLIGIRYPAQDVALEIISRFDSPITATSANLSGCPSPITVNDALVPHDFCIDVGALKGTPSTVVDLVHREIIRPGANIERIGAVLAEWVQCE